MRFVPFSLLVEKKKSGLDFRVPQCMFRMPILNIEPSQEGRVAGALYPKNLQVNTKNQLKSTSFSSADAPLTFTVVHTPLQSLSKIFSSTTQTWEAFPSARLCLTPSTQTPQHQWEKKRNKRFLCGYTSRRSVLVLLETAVSLAQCAQSESDC